MMRKPIAIVEMRMYRDKRKARAVVRLLRRAGIKVSTEPKALGRKDLYYTSGKGKRLFVAMKD